MDDATAKRLIEEWTPRIEEELNRLARIRCYMDGDHDKPYTPDKDDLQYRTLAERAVTNLLPMVRNATLHQLFIDGVRTKDALLDEYLWDVWQTNQFDMRQTQAFSAAIEDGVSYGIVEKPSPLSRVQKPVMRAVSARQMYAVYEDQLRDEYPAYAFMLNRHGQIKEIWDEEGKTTVTWNPPKETGKPTPVIGKTVIHGFNVCPVVPIAPIQDLEGRRIGEIEPLIPVQNRINQVSFDLLLVQHYGAFKIRGFSGMGIAKDANGNKIPPKLRPDTLALLPADGKPFQLEGTPLEGYIAAFDKAIKDFSIASQTPAHYMLGDMVNLSAEALTAAETTLIRKVAAYKQALGEAVEKMLRLVAKLGGFTDIPADTEVSWEDVSSRSWSQTIDGLVKLQSLHVPDEELWARIPNTSPAQIERWKKLNAEQDPINKLAEELGNGRINGDSAGSGASGAN